VADEKRRHDVMVRLNDAELAWLDEIRPGGVPRAVYLRNLLREPPTAEDIADRQEALALLSGLARAGKVSAAIALERALRATPKSDEDWDDELSRIIVDD
jgi:hypothetical protein